MLREKITNLETELIKTHATLGGGDPRDKETIKTLLSQMDTLTKTNESLVKELATTASEKRKCLNTQDVKEKMPSTELKSRPTKPNLLIGSSIIRDLNPEGIKDTEVICIRGGTIQDINEKLREKSIGYKRIVLVAGTNDCSHGITPENIISKYKELLVTAKQLATESVVVSSISPRADRAEWQSCTESVNAELMELCKSQEVDFINNDSIFRLQDNTINDGYLLRDGLHLTFKGSEKLAANLKLEPAGSIIITNKIQKPKPQQESNRNHTLSKTEPNEYNKHFPQLQSLKRPNEYQEVSLGPTTEVTNTNNKTWHKSLERPRYNEVFNHYHPNINYVSQQRGTTAHPMDDRNKPKRSAYTHRPSTKCYWCGEEGHNKDSCFFDGPLRCYSCGILGHKSKHCRPST